MASSPGRSSAQLPSLLGAAVAQLPAALVLAAVAVLVFGLLPWESIALAWTVVAVVAVIAVLGPSLQWPAALMDISPITQLPRCRAARWPRRRSTGYPGSPWRPA